MPLLKSLAVYSVLLVSHTWTVKGVDHMLGFEPSWYLDYSEVSDTDNFGASSQITGQISVFRDQIVSRQEACYNIENGPKNLWHIGTRSKVFLTPYVTANQKPIVGWAFYTTTDCQKGGLVDPKVFDEAQYIASTVQLEWLLTTEGPLEKIPLLENNDDVYVDMPTFIPLQNIASFTPIFEEYTNIGANFVGTDSLGYTYEEGEAALLHLDPEWVVMYRDLDGNTGRLAYSIAFDRNVATYNVYNEDYTMGFCHEIPENMGLEIVAVLQHKLNLMLKKYPIIKGQPLDPMYDQFRPQIATFAYFSDDTCSPGAMVQVDNDDQYLEVDLEHGLKYKDYRNAEKRVEDVRSILPLFKRAPGNIMSTYYAAMGNPDPINIRKAQNMDEE